MIQPAPWHWIAFIGGVVALAVVDLRVFQAAPRRRVGGKVSPDAGLVRVGNFSVVLFGGLAGLRRGDIHGRVSIEWSLSLDNLLVFAMVFAQFHVPQAAQYRVLFWGILARWSRRLGMVLLGAGLIATWDWVLPLLGLLILYLGA